MTVLPRSIMPPVRGRKTLNRVNGPFLYELGAKIRPLAAISYGTTVANSLITLYTAEGALVTLATNASFLRLRTFWRGISELTEVVRSTREKIQESDATETLEWGVAFEVSQAARTFEAVLLAELSVAALYMVAKKSAYDMTDLIENGQVAFPSDLTIKVPECIPDVRQATKCIAFELPTAAEYHLHRANEAVVHSYYDCVTNGASRPGCVRQAGVNLGGV